MTTIAPAKLSLADFQKGSMNLPPRIVVHGRPGVGKTEFAAWAPAPIFILSPGETGLQTLMDSGRVDPNIYSKEIESFAELLGAIEFLRTEKHSRRTLVIDTISGSEKLANLACCQLQYDGDMSGKGFMNYQEGYRVVAAGIWKTLLAALDQLRHERKMLLILLSHTGVRNHKNPNGTDYTRWIPQFDGGPAWDATFNWSDIVLLGDYEIDVKKEGPDKNAKGKAKGGDYRMFRTNWNAAWDAKNRHGFPVQIPMGNSGREAWTNLAAALELAKAATSTSAATVPPTETPTAKGE